MRTKLLSGGLTRVLGARSRKTRSRSAKETLSHVNALARPTKVGSLLEVTRDGSGRVRNTKQKPLGVLKNHHTLVAVAGLLSLVACSPASGSGDRVATSDLAITAQENVERALRGTHRAGSFLAESASVAEMFDSMGGSGETCESPPCTVDGCPPVVCTSDPVTVEDMQEQRTELDDGITELMETLRDEIFTAENLESEEASSVTYLLGPSTFCEDTVADDPLAGAPAPAPMLDPECVDQINRLQPRIRLSSPGEGNVDVQLLLTSEKRNPVTLELYQDHVGAIMDLGETKAALDAIGEDTENLVSMVGKYGFELRKNGELDFSLRSSVLEAVEIVTSNDLGEQIRIALGQSIPMFELRFDGNARQVTGSMDYGTFAVDGPLNAFRDTFADTEYDPVTGEELPGQVYTGHTELFVAGLEGSITFDGTTDRLDVLGIGLGDTSSTLKHDGTVLAQVDLNAQAGRHFDLSVQKQPQGEPIVTFSPTFDVSVLLNFAPLANQISDISSSILNDTLRIWFDGQNPSVQGRADALGVVSGTLNMTSTSTPSANLSVPAGMCLVESDAEAPAHEFLGAFTVSSCP
jgi:hypothetical protein